MHGTGGNKYLHFELLQPLHTQSTWATDQGSDHKGEQECEAGDNMILYGIAPILKARDERPF